MNIRVKKKREEWEISRRIRKKKKKRGTRERKLC